LTNLLQHDSMKMMNLRGVNKGININYDGNYDYTVNMVRNASYEVLGNHSGKVKRNG